MFFEVARFISSQVMAAYVSAELAEKLLNPLVFQWDSVVAEVPPAAVKGYEASLLIDLCNALEPAHSASSSVVFSMWLKAPAPARNTKQKLRSASEGSRC